MTEREKKVNKDWQKTIDNWRNRLEHFNVQLHLGAKEATELFENQKNQLNSWVQSAQKQIEESKLFDPSKTQELKTKLDELKVQAALGKAETRDALKEQQKKISHSMQGLKKDVEQSIQKAAVKEGELEGSLRDQLDDFKTRFDLLRLRSHLAQMDAEDAWNEKKEDLSNKLQTMKKKLDVEKESGAERWKGFSGEMQEAWKHFVSAIDKAF